MLDICIVQTGAAHWTLSVWHSWFHTIQFDQSLNYLDYKKPRGDGGRCLRFKNSGYGRCFLFLGVLRGDDCGWVAYGGDCL